MKDNKEEIERLANLQRILEGMGIPISAAADIGRFALIPDTENNWFCTLPIFLYELIKKTIEKLKEKDGFVFKVYYTMCGTVDCYCNAKHEKEASAIIKVAVESYFKGKVIDTLNKYRSLNISTFPNISDMDNYPNDLKFLYELALEGFEKDPSYKAILTGNPGTGKTWFAKIVSKRLIKIGKCGILLSSSKNIKGIVDFIKQLSIDLNLLFVVDDMEVGALDRNLCADESTPEMLHILNGIEEISNMRFLGISNLPQIMDKAILRPGRIDILIPAQETKPSVENISRILKSFSMDIQEKYLNMLAERLFANFEENMPISFYSQAIKLFLIYKDIDKVFPILQVFYDNRALYRYDDALKANPSISKAYKDTANTIIREEKL